MNDDRDDDAQAHEPRPLRDRPLMPNVWELAGPHRGEPPTNTDDDDE